MSALVRRARVTILCDNSVAGPGVLAEHGLSLHIDADGRAFVFDTGASGVFVGNAARLGIDLSQAAPVVLSHGHYDHTGGLATLLSAYGGREVIGHPEVFAAKFSRQRSRPARAIGCPQSRRCLLRLGATLKLSAQPQEIAPGVVTTGVIPRTTDYEHIPIHLMVKPGRRLERDSFEDEQAIVARTRRGLVVIVGCAHRGLINTIRRAIELTGDGRVCAVIGGTHLAAADPPQVERTIKELRALDLRQLVACHCTGFGPSAELRSALGESFSPGGVGATFTV
jgi:7,8-dihydropterin-6-yl-methyl-4-(beta-D-ribofuranosyl)aminobenzene 5'-phosphate synthase